MFDIYNSNSNYIYIELFIAFFLWIQFTDIVHCAVYDFDENEVIKELHNEPYFADIIALLIKVVVITPQGIVHSRVPLQP